MASPQRALMLAAGVGSRLGRSEPVPKVLLEFGGCSLLARHIEILASVGVEEVVIGVGYRSDLVHGALGALGSRVRVRTVDNPDYRAGSVVTLHGLLAAEAGRAGDFLLMDADVLYDRRMLRALVDSRHRNCFLLDRDLEPGDEPVKLCLRDGRPVEFRKRPDPSIAYDAHGESVGFFRFEQAIGERLRVAAAGYLDARRDEPYEEVIRDVVLADRSGAFGFEDVTALPWIEIDFAEDVERAARRVLPALEPLPASAEGCERVQ